MKKYLALIIAVTFVFAACARMPKPATSQKIIYKYFKKYAKKYPDTIYGQHGIREVEVESQSEIRKHYAAVEAYVKLNDGTLKRVYATIEKKILCWKFVSWEDGTGL